MAVVNFTATLPSLETALGHEGLVVVLADDSLSAEARKIDRKTKGALSRAMESAQWAETKTGKGLSLAFPAGMAAQAVLLVRLPRTAGAIEARKAGAEIGRALQAAGGYVLAQGLKECGALVEGIALRAYHHGMKAKTPDAPGDVIIACTNPDAVSAEIETARHRAAATHFTRDLTNDPANVLTTTEFADRLDALSALGLEVEILEEPDLEKLGMRALLAVGQGSEMPSKVAVMRWRGEGVSEDTPPLALVGKGVVFDTGGISIKPAGGMEEMIMDMGGAGVVAGVMQLIAARKSKSHVVGLVGLVENMPDGKAQRPGDVVRSMKGDTIEVINTDAEGRLVLADVLWYAQERFKPAAVIDLATLTGAIVVALGYEHAGVFANDDELCDAFMTAAKHEDEGAWRMPLGAGYDALIKSRVADMKNTGGRWGGAITAAQFLQRFVQEGTPWMHLDIAAVAMPTGETDYAPKGASGWGVRALDRLIRDSYEA